jgi:hypothetical protein
VSLAHDDGVLLESDVSMAEVDALLLDRDVSLAERREPLS